MKQNIYDDQTFFDGYFNLRKDESGLNAVLEEPAMHQLFGDMNDLRVLDAGCGFGKNCIHFINQGAKEVVGIDISERMIVKANELNNHAKVSYHQVSLEDASFEAGSFDLVTSSLALHYIEDYTGAIQQVYSWLKPGGRFIFSVEHPIATALPEQQWITDEKTGKQYWPVSNYSIQGPRSTNWFVNDVIKYHRTIETYINTLLQHGFRLLHMGEPVPAAEYIVVRPDLQKYELRPAFLIISVQK